MEDWIGMGLARIDYTSNPSRPTIILTEEAKAQIQAPWRHRVIIKVLGKSISYHSLLMRLTHLWNPTTPIRLMDLPNSYFLACLSSEEEVAWATKGGPWLIQDYYIVVR